MAERTCRAAQLAEFAQLAPEQLWPVRLLRCLQRRPAVLAMRPKTVPPPAVESVAPPAPADTEPHPSCDVCGQLLCKGQRFMRYGIVTDTGYSTVGGVQCAVEGETPIVVCESCDTNRFEPWLRSCPLPELLGPG